MTLPTSEPISLEENQEGIIASADGEGLKFCADCKWLLGVRHKTEDYSNWHCVNPQNLIKNEKRWNLVTGIQEYIRAYQEGSLVVLRTEERYCGPTGKWFEKYERPEYRSSPTIGGKEAVALTEEVFNKEELEANKKAAQERIEAMKRKKLGL
jgi:hypothetical protein